MFVSPQAQNTWQLSLLAPGAAALSASLPWRFCEFSPLAPPLTWGWDFTAGPEASSAFACLTNLRGWHDNRLDPEVKMRPIL